MNICMEAVATMLWLIPCCIPGLVTSIAVLMVRVEIGAGTGWGEACEVRAREERRGRVEENLLASRGAIEKLLKAHTFFHQLEGFLLG